MTQQAWKATDIKGLTPALDLRQAQGLFALGGKNYAFDSKGPKSCFGNRLLDDFAYVEPLYFQGIRLKLRGGDRVFHFYPEGIYEWDEESLSHTLIYVHASTNGEPYRWTYGYLNRKIYLCHPTTGLLVYDIDSEVCEPLVGPGVPSEAVACCVDNGRLCVIDIEFLYWSAQSNGSD